jgi:PleD family two-component response regulator
LSLHAKFRFPETEIWFEETRFECAASVNNLIPSMARSLPHPAGLCWTAQRAIMTVILIVEDDILANERLEFILQRAGYEVLSATSADEGGRVA